MAFTSPAAPKERDGGGKDGSAKPGGPDALPVLTSSFQEAQLHGAVYPENGSTRTTWPWAFSWIENEWPV